MYTFTICIMLQENNALNLHIKLVAATEQKIYCIACDAVSHTKTGTSGLMNNLYYTYTGTYVPNN